MHCDMYSAIVPSPEYEGLLLPIAASTRERYFLLGQAIMAGIPGAADKCIKDMGGRVSSKTGVAAPFLELLPGIGAEMRARGIAPVSVTKQLIEVAPLLVTPLVAEIVLARTKNNEGIDIFDACEPINSVHKRLSDRLVICTPARTPQLNVLGRMVMHFARTRETMRHFTD